MKKTISALMTGAFAALLVAAGAALPLSSQAAEGDVTWSVAPASAQGPDGRTLFDYRVDPGVAVSDIVSITNFSATDQTFQLYASDGVNEFDGGEYSIQTADGVSTDLGVWTTLSQKEVTIGANQRADIPFTIVVPSNATPGDHSAGIVAAITRKGTGEGQAVDVEQRVGSRIYMRVSGEVQASFTASGMVAGYDGSLNPIGLGDVSGHYTLQNNGNLRLALDQTLRITGPFGIPLAEVKTEAVPDFLPGQLVNVPIAVDGVAPLFFLGVDAQISSRSAAAASSAEIAGASTSTTTWAIPWSLLGVLVVIAGLLGFVVWRRRVNETRMREAIEHLTRQGREQALAGQPDEHLDEKPRENAGASA
ncbi:WxL protein peptidoglycan domain-containing protein [Luethyella okanaganae]|uniref:WxL protein peptidoglycan domain-containing protein n=1 Tax=Luethyella okanaganae TaxID=69372 RepID=A0ABW1VHX5_9MICO